MMTYEEKLALARIIYRSLNDTVMKWEMKTRLGISCHWSGWVTVAGESFPRHILDESCTQEDVYIASIDKLNNGDS